MSQTVASNPAGIRVDLAHAFKCDGKDLILLAVGLVVGGIVAPFHWQAGLIIMGIGAFFPIASLFSLPQHFRDGDVCPAVVVDPDRQLVAVMTDLSKTGRSKCVIKVLRQPLKRAVQKPVKKGTRLAFVAMYGGHPAAQNWTTFGGYLADSGTRSTKALQRVLSSIDDSDWEKLIEGLKQIEKPYSPGMYDLKADSRSRAEGSTPLKARKRSFSRVTKFGIGFVAFLLLLALSPLLLNALRGGRGQNANGGGAPAPAQNPAPVIAAADHPPAVPFPQPGNGWGPSTNATPSTTPVSPAPVATPLGWPSTDSPSPSTASPPTVASSPFRPKLSSADPETSPANSDAASPFRPKQSQPTDPASAPATTAASPFRPKRPEPAASGTASPGSSTAPDREWQVGDKAEAFWGSNWYPVTILAIEGQRGFKVHWEGYTDSFDEVLTRDRLRPRSGN